MTFFLPVCYILLELKSLFPHLNKTSKTNVKNTLFRPILQLLDVQEDTSRATKLITLFNKVNNFVSSLIYI